MPLAKDEQIGLLVAALVGGSALGLFSYRELAAAPAPSAAEVDNGPTQSERDAFAETLELAFVEDGTDAIVTARSTTLEIVWFPCSKQMMQRLLHRKKDALTQKVREQSGLSLDRLRELGFTSVACDNTRGNTIREPVKPAAK